MGRMRQNTINTQTWEPALQAINKMERAVVTVMTKPILSELTGNDVLDWMIPAEPLQVLRAAYPHSNVSDPGVRKELEFSGTKIYLALECIDLKCITPCIGLVAVQAHTPRHEQFCKLFETIVGIHRQHTKVRRVLNWFTSQGVTMGAARHYFPTLQSLLPSHHAFFQVKGDRFKDVVFPYEIAEFLRETPEIIAKGLLCDPNTNGVIGTGRWSVRVGVHNGQTFYLFKSA